MNLPVEIRTIIFGHVLQSSTRVIRPVPEHEAKELRAEPKCFGRPDPFVNFNLPFVNHQFFEEAMQVICETNTVHILDLDSANRKFKTRLKRIFKHAHDLILDVHNLSRGASAWWIEALAAKTNLRTIKIVYDRDNP